MRRAIGFSLVTAAASAVPSPPCRNFLIGGGAAVAPRAFCQWRPRPVKASVRAAALRTATTESDV